MTTYELEVDDAIWERWTASLPEGVGPDRRIADLLIADIEGRVGEGGSTAADPAGEPPYGCPLCEETFGSLDDRDYHLVEDHEVALI